MENDLIANFWKRTQPDANAVDTLWEDELAFLYKFGISLEASVGFLYGQKPSLEQFRDWVSQHTGIVEIPNDETGDVLTPEDLDFWDANGYVVVKNAIPKADCQATCDAIWAFLEKSPEDKASWYLRHPEQMGMMVNFSNHPTLNKNRLSPKIQKAYRQLYQTDRIYKTIDKVSFNPPVHEHHSFKGSPLHWDVSLQLPIPFRLQGLIYLSDCGEKDGAFHCVPGFHHQIEDWIRTVPENIHPRNYALQALQPTAVTGEAGDMVIWHQALPHCATPNYGNVPRMVQYLSYFPEAYKESGEWI